VKTLREWNQATVNPIYLEWCGVLYRRSFMLAKIFMREPLYATQSGVVLSPDRCLFPASTMTVAEWDFAFRIATDAQVGYGWHS
jgi:hypothetical protein